VALEERTAEEHILAGHTAAALEGRTAEERILAGHTAAALEGRTTEARILAGHTAAALEERTAEEHILAAAGRDGDMSAAPVVRKEKSECPVLPKDWGMPKPVLSEEAFCRIWHLYK